MKKIVIVEEEEKLRTELEYFLKNCGYEVETITNFENTLQELFRKKTDLFLLDSNVPNRDGEYLYKNIEKVCETPIIMVTSRNTEFWMNYSV